MFAQLFFYGICIDRGSIIKIFNGYMKKIVVIGSSNTDMTVRSERFPETGQTLLGGDFMMSQGGKGANQAVAIARLGGRATFVAKVGDDMFGREARQYYAAEGIDTDYVSVDGSAPSGVALINVNGRGENRIVVASGANYSISREDIERAAGVIASADIVLMQLESPLACIEYAARIACDAGARVILNPAPAAALPDTIYKSLYAIVPNQSEASALSGVEIVDRASAVEAARAIAARGVGRVVITLGADGALVYEHGSAIFVAALNVDAVDTTAAGDTFCGALCVALSEGRSLSEAVRFATCCSAISVTRKGAQPSIPYRAEVDAMIASEQAGRKSQPGLPACGALATAEL